MEKDDRIFLREILDRIERVNGYLRGFDFEHFQTDLKTIDAVVRNIEVIGEAASNLGEEFRSKHEQVPWRKMIATRNRIIHGYASVDIEIIWNISHNDLAKLASEIEQIIVTEE